MRAASLCLVGLASFGSPVHGQSTRLVTGRVVRGARKAPIPVASRWVVLHRVGSDRAGPLDSTRTGSAGGFSLRYRAFGDSNAVYFASSSYDGITYFTSPLRAPVVGPDEATIVVYDTSSGPVAIKVAGHHLIIGAPQPNGRRPVGEVYDLENDTTVTWIARDTLPVWSTHMPDAATSFQLNSAGDVAPGAVKRAGSAVLSFAPISPGVRQVAFTYELPASAFPLSVPTTDSGEVLEVLVEAADSRVSGAGISEKAPVSTEGRTFHRYLSQNVPPNAVLRVDLPRDLGTERTNVMRIVTLAIVVMMTVALLIAWARRLAPAAVVATPASYDLLRELVALDADFERRPSSDTAAREVYDSTRAQLKARLADALAAERRPA